MSDEVQKSDNSAFKTTPLKIRSRHRRRLLNRLTDGGDTVSSLARAVNLQIPHASAELRRLRNEGLVASDQAPGSRGARLHLTELGWERIRSDEWARAIEATPLPRDSDSFCLLDRDGENVLIGLTSVPKSPMILIPNRPPNAVSPDGDSTGNEGVQWLWVVLRERTPRWFDLDSMEMVATPPHATDPSSLEAYAEVRTVIGLIRARLIEAERPIALANGAWFESPKSSQNPPLPEMSHHRGEWVLGATHELTQNVRPKVPICAVLPDRLSRAMLMRTARLNSLTIGDLGGLDAEGDDYPISALTHWITLAHPRLSNAEREKRLLALRDRLTSERKVRIEDSTWRRFKRDWVDSSFSLHDDSLRMFDTRGLSPAAIESLIRWAINSEESPQLVIEMPNEISKDVVTSVLNHPRLRVLISESETQSFSNYDCLRPDQLRPLPWLEFQTSLGISMPVRLLDPLSHSTPVSDEFTSEAVTPWKVAGLSHFHDCNPEVLESGYLSMINSALAQYPNGNEEWANQMESSYPIAAWIASPKKTRWPRWQRLNSRLGADWLILFDLDYIPLERLSELAEQSPDRVLDYFAIVMERKIREDHEIALRTRPAVDPSAATKGSAWVAAQFLANAPWIPREMHDDLLRWALEAWLSFPPSRSLAALEGVSWMYSARRGRSAGFGPILQGILRISENLPDNHDLRLWSKLVNRMLYDVELTENELSSVIHHLPRDWWAPVAKDFLKKFLSTEESTQWLIEQKIPWPALILRPIGELSLAPGLRGVKHTGVDVELHSLLVRRLSGRREREGMPDSADSLLDLLDAIESAVEGKAPPSGRTHSLVGWLAQPLESWPEISPELAMDGDAAVAERILTRRTGFNDELRTIKL